MPPPSTSITNKVSEPTVEHGMLVFENEESFKAMAQKLEKMSFEDRKSWEKNIGFKSYDRLCNEIMDAEIANAEKYDRLPSDEQQKILATGNFERHAKLTFEYLEKGIVKILQDEDKTESVDLKFLLYSKLVNIDGFIVVGNRILQYTENKFKAIRSRDYSKIDTLKKINNNISNENYYVTSLKSTSKTIFQPDYCNIWRISQTIDNKKVLLNEYFTAYDYYDLGLYYESDTYYKVIYIVDAKAEKKALFGNNWIQDKGADVSLWGNADLLTNGTTYTNSGWKEIHGGTNGFIEQVVFNGDISYLSLPSIPTSYWVANRNGGSNGIYLTVENHEIVPNY